MKKSNTNRLGWILLSPSLLILGIAGLAPFFYVIYVGTYSWNVFSKERGKFFVGIQNYRDLVFDSMFLGTLSRTLFFSFLVVTIELVLGFILALSLMKDFKGKTFFRTIYVLPVVVAPIAVGATWRLMMAQGHGPIPYFLNKLFGWEFNTGASTTQAWIAIVLMDVWHWTPFVTLTLLAGLLAIPKEPIEAASVDGANRVQMYRYLILPMLLPVILITVFIRVMDSLRSMEDVYMLTNGGPGSSTTFVGLHIFRTVFSKQEYGYGSSMSLMVLYFTIVICWLLFNALTGKGSKSKI
ncbi:MAG: sugar ABC transporter permease [Candidatus Nanopelagicus sp.]|nr:sugar ABC transporter permease [Candidatus Nanopelagicus sp.]